MGFLSNLNAHRGQPSRLSDRSGSGTHPRPERLRHVFEQQQGALAICRCGRPKGSVIHKAVTPPDTVIREGIEILREMKDI